MVLLSNPRQFFHRQYGRGVGYYYSDMYGNGIFLDSLKNLGKLFFRGSKALYKIVKPRAITIAKETLNEVKPKIQKTLTDASSKWIHNLINQPSNIKEGSKETVRDVVNDTKEIINETLPAIKERAVKSYHEIINGGSMGRKRKSTGKKLLSSESKSIIKALARKQK